ncbi:hypothetical protein P375_00495 [Gallibacterium genomosp. 2]|uniref:Uncharacterized protein n=1 Tax=Gallibacterium genomosp. 2 TaxID=155517 RepID=A0A0A2XUG4_9PAST|nr:hypothetical protein [Gallibacterium genomosp. 2]KGQ34657.1 hypothetical protein P375_00495 [Gallibacterium genomosp. 2]
MFDEIIDLWRGGSIYERTGAILLCVIILCVFSYFGYLTIITIVDYGWMMGTIVAVVLSLFIALLTVLASPALSLLLIVIAGLVQAFVSLCQAIYRLLKR